MTFSYLKGRRDDEKEKQPQIQDNVQQGKKVKLSLNELCTYVLYSSTSLYKALYVHTVLRIEVRKSEENINTSITSISTQNHPFLCRYTRFHSIHIIKIF